MIKGSLKYFVACGLLIYVLFFLSLKFGANPFIDLTQLFFDFVIFSIFIFFSVYEFRKTSNGGILHFWQGMSIGFAVYIPATLFFGLILFFNLRYDPDILMNYKTEALNFLIDKKDIYIAQFGNEQFELQKKAIDEISSNYLLLMSIVKKGMIGLFITPIVSVILRKKPKQSKI